MSLAGPRDIKGGWPDLERRGRSGPGFAGLGSLTVIALLCAAACTKRAAQDDIPAGFDDLTVVEILNEAQGQPPTRICWGTLLACRDGTASVLTAAHCVTEDDDRQHPVRVVRFHDGSVGRVTQWQVHPRFSRSDLSSNFDLASLRVRGCSPSSSIRSVLQKPPQLQVGDDLSVRAGTGVGGQSEWAHVRLEAITATTLLLTPALGLCHGSSGAPVVTIEGHSLALAGVVSTGPRECGRNVTVARISPVDLEFLMSTQEHLPPATRKLSCGECIEQAAAGNAPCVSSVGLCRKDSNCKRELEAFVANGSDIPSWRRTASPHDEALTRATRCVCIAACREECLAACGVRER